jgi:hypothetical protein
VAAPTRLYLSGTAASFNVGGSVNASGVGGIWESKIALANTTQKLTLTADGTRAIAANNNVVGSGTDPNDIWYFSAMTDVLPNGKLLNGNFMGTALCRESATNTNGYTQCGVYVVSSAGALLATLVAAQSSGGTEFNNPSANNRMFPRNYSSGSGPAISSYTTVDATSRIVIEMGIRIETTRTSDTLYQYIGNNGGSDLPAGDGASNSTTANPWFEFSIDIFAAPAGGGSARSQVGAVYGFHEHPADDELGSWKKHRSGLWVRSWED